MMKYAYVLTVLVMCLVAVTCEVLDEETQTDETTVANQQSEQQAQNVQERFLERLTKLEKDVATLQQNQKLINDGFNSNNNNYKQLPENALDPCETARSSGVFKIQQLNQNVYCEMDTFGGGWLVIQQRVRKQDGFRLNFDRYWTEFQAGFGTVEKDGEFWLGLETLHQITHSGEYELAVEFRDSNGTYGYARYSKFRVGVAYDKYRLTVDGYLGTLGDGLSRQNNSRFTTFDSDNDSWKENCAKNFANGGWWYSDCGSAPNYSGGPWWDNFSNNVIYKNYGTYVRMMIRQNKCSVSLN
ncbi:fibrinogen-like protein A isoform X3 [Culex pipiens pallens]|uniref:fibrinogen-like protein A isoform X3 n=1 Tax=Culex pipiens pallens TaxID=42434 RepID=UPI0022AA8500|nr:fibrinogen-like protein A isoform X3 [Culex pipiens pallens]